eukprot:gene2235-2757_t
MKNDTTVVSANLYSAPVVYQPQYFIYGFIKINGTRKTTKFSINLENDQFMDPAIDSFITVSFKDNVTTLFNPYTLQANNQNYEIYQYGDLITPIYKKYVSINYIPPAGSIVADVPESSNTLPIFDVVYDDVDVKQVFSDGSARIFEVVLPYPYGISRLNQLNQFRYKYSLLYNVNEGKQIQLTINKREFRFTPKVFIPGSTGDQNPPALLSINLVYSDSYRMVLNILAQDDIGITKFIFDKNFVKAEDVILQGTLKGGQFELTFHTSWLPTILNSLQIEIQDEGVNYSPKYLSNQFIRLSPINIIPQGTKLNWRLDDFQYFDFQLHEMDTTDKEVSNYLFFNVTDAIPTHRPLLTIMNTFLEVEQFYGYWDSNLQVYVIPFTLPKNSINDRLYYKIGSMFPIPFYDLETVFGPKSIVQVLSTKKYTVMPPIVKNVEINYAQSGGLCGWELTIESEVNGFSFGTLEVYSEIGVIPGKIRFNSTNRIQGDEFLGVYLVTFNCSLTCRSQKYTFRNVYLESFDKNPVATLKVDPLLGLEKDIPKILGNCSRSLIMTPPSLVEFSFSPTEIDVGSQSRTINFTFKTKAQTGSDISTLHLPYIFISSSDTVPIGFQSTLLSIDGSGVHSYSCSFDIPYGFGYGKNISTSIYGIVDYFSNIRGYSTLDLLSFSPNFAIIKRTHSNGIHLESHTPISKNGGPLMIDGFGFGLQRIPYLIDFFNGTTIESSDYIVYTNTLLSINLPKFDTKVSITLRMFSSNNVNSFGVLTVPNSNSLIIKPTRDYNIPNTLPSPYPEPTPEPTLSPSPSPSPVTTSTTNPSTTDASTTNPSTTNPSTGASTTDPSTTNPSTTGGSTTDPLTTNPSTTGASTTDPSTTYPSTTGASTTNPSTTNPSTTNPSTTGASTTDPPTTNPSTTNPSTTGASTTDPSTTDPSTTGASTTDPSTTGASTTNPSTTGASTTNPSTTGASTTNPSTTGASTTNPSTTEQDFSLLSDQDKVSLDSANSPICNNSKSSSSKLSTGAIIGIAVGGGAFLIGASVGTAFLIKKKLSQKRLRSKLSYRLESIRNT